MHAQSSVDYAYEQRVKQLCAQHKHSAEAAAERRTQLSAVRRVGLSLRLRLKLRLRVRFQVRLRLRLRVGVGLCV